MPTVPFDPLSAETLEDPASEFKRLREQCPVHRSEQFGRPLYTLANTADIQRVLLSPVVFSTRDGPGIPYDSGWSGDFNRYDPPEHTEWRRFVRPEFLRRTLSAYRDRIQTVAHHLIDAVADAREGDLHDFFAYPLPVTILIDLLGVPQTDAGRIKAWADEIALSIADPTAGEAAMMTSLAYIEELAQSRREAADRAGVPGEEAVGAVVPEGWVSSYALRHFRGERLPMDELCTLILSLIIAGHETTSSLLTNLIWRLLERRELWQKLVSEPSLAEAAVEESLRFDPPVLGLCRTNTEPVTIGAHQLPKGTKVLALYASANRDPALYEDPDTFRLDRDLDTLRKHFSFGGGVHLCPGAVLARDTGKIALEALLGRLPSLRLNGETSRIEPALLWGRRKLPVAWD